ncbi:MAG: M1 family peptidase [Flavobacteriales bacterium TMED191]|nr:MAG: M1 family peptidase [Flavobacteriales bacterium TMED191]
MKKLLSILSLLLMSLATSQNEDNINFTADSLILNTNTTIWEKPAIPYNPLAKPNTYSSNENPNYWKNKMPYAGYWQQDVHYIIDAEIVDSLNMIKANQQLIYTNNSPDELDFVFFHLYANAFEPDSYLDQFRKGNKIPTTFRKDEIKKKNLEILSVTTNNNNLDIEIDNTIMKVILEEPLRSGETIKFDINFESYFGGEENSGNVRRRMKTYTEFGNKHFNGVHWYPRISVYDSKFGWTTDQHLGKEFYGNFGCFDVELTFPDNYIVEATGFMTNREEVLPKELMKKLDISNFANKKYNTPPSTIIRYNPNKKKTWKFHAENVHDFAFTADPSYRIGVAEWNGVKAYSLAQEQHASKWQNVANYAAEIIKVFSEDFGMYTYHKIIVADARSGMEYPMITLDRGSDPGYRGLLIHEIAHMWFFGQVGNNETYRAALDEGFTQFLTAWATEVIEGKYMTRSPSYVDDTLLNNQDVDLLSRLKWLKNNRTFLNKYYDEHTNQLDAKDDDAFYRYTMDASENNTPKLNTHSHDFGGSLAHRGSYTHVYGKTATMLYNLQYVLGDELFIAAMRNYFETWKIAHPYLDDFRNSIIQFTKVDLNWFFDQWLDTNKDLDYAVKRVEKLSNDTVAITISREGEMEMPIDLTIDSKFGTRYNFHIPNNWFVKKTSATVLPRWIGYGNLNKEYTFKTHIPSGVKNIMIDESGRLADSYMINNRFNGNIDFSLDYGVYKWANLRKYELQAKPDLWYNSFDGVKIGTSVSGHYLKKHHVIDANMWLNTGAMKAEEFDSNSKNDKISYQIKYSTSMYKYVKNSRFRLAASEIDGLNHYSIGYNIKDISKVNSLDISLNGFERKDVSDLNYLIYNDLWIPNRKNTNITINLSHKYYYLPNNKLSGVGNIQFSLKSSSIMSDYDFAQITLEAINKNSINGYKINTRFFVQRGFGNNFPLESMLYAAGTNPEGLMENQFTRSRGWIPESWTGYSNNTGTFHMGGGLNLRGFSGYYMTEPTDEGSVNVYKGTSGMAFNTEVDYTSKIPKLNYWGLNSYIFMDVGVMDESQNAEKIAFSRPYMDLGLGFSWELSRLWDHALESQPLMLRFDLPLFVNHAPSTENAIKLRCIVGLNRAF